MAQTNYTPISLYYSATATNVPTAGNLVAGELALNTADGKLFYKDSAGVVQTLASKSTGTIGGSTTQVQYNSSGSFAGSANFVWDNTNVRLGLGTSSPATQLHLVAPTGQDAQVRMTGSTTNNGTVQFYNATTGALSDIYADNTKNLVFRTNGVTEAMRIDSSGNVGIGTSSPSTFSAYTKLSVLNGVAVGVDASNAGRIVGSTTTGTELSYLSMGGNYNIGSTGEIALATTTAKAMLFGTNGSERMRIDSSGNLMVGTTSQIQSGKQTISYNASTTNGLVLSDSNNTASGRFISFNLGASAIGSVERVSSTSAVVYNTTSDQRLKSNIVDASPVLDKLMNVKVRQYDWTGSDVHQDAGFIAQELAPILSGIVTEGKTEEDMWQLDYSRLTPYLVKAIQEQQALIESLTTRLTALENK